MSSGTRVVFGFMLFAALVFAALQFYGSRSIARRYPDSPARAAREAVQADNTVIGIIGGIDTFEPIALETTADGRSAHLEASVVGGRESGQLVSELVLEEDRWIVRTASFTFSDGTTIPVAGSSGR